MADTLPADLVVLYQVRSRNDFSDDSFFHLVSKDDQFLCYCMDWTIQLTPDQTI